MGILQQTFFLVRKNFQVKRRHKRLTFQEIIIPIYWMLILLVIKLTSKGKVNPAIGSNEIPSFQLNQRQQPVTSNGSIKSSIAVVTNGDSLCKNVFSVLKNVTEPRTSYIEFNDTEQLLEYYRKFGEKSKLGLGIVFERNGNGVSYTIHFAENIIPDLKDKTISRDKCFNVKSWNPISCPSSMYITNNIASLQSVIDSSISKVVANLPYYIVPNITVQMMPKREYIPSLSAFSTMVPIYTVLAFAPYIMILLINLVGEKEKKHKELLRIMGMYDTAYWLSWFLTYAFLLLLASLLINAIAVPSGILGNSNFVLMVIVFFLFGLSLIMFAFMFTPLFKKASNAGIVANLTTVIFGVLIIPLRLPNVPNYAKWLSCLLSPTAFALVLSEAVDSTGLQFDNLSTKGTFPAGNAVIMIIVDIFLYLFLALYLDSVIPAEYGKRRPPHFIFMPSFWRSVFCGDQTTHTDLSRQLSARGIQNMDDVEPVGQEMIGKEAISIHKLRKVFPGKEDVVAVDDFSMDIYEGQVTALLGHNGAGKSTLIAALTGMISPTCGTAMFYGKDINDLDDMIQIRKNMGVCPQQDVLFDFVTVREHLELYTGLKGVPSAERKSMVSTIIQDIGLEDKADELAKNLSGGQKRKLSVGIALCGNPKVLFLDEPTSGMDPHSRRSMWSLLQKQSKNKVVLLTTHFMDEADILADYKAIMSKGKLRCAGSSLFLKNRFGIGYHLTMSLSENCDYEALVNLVKSKVDGADVIRHHGYELAFSLPFEEVGNFSGLFATLEEHNDGIEGCATTRLGVSSYGVSMTTLEEVFLQLEETMEKDSKEEDSIQTQMAGFTGSQDVLVNDENDMSNSRANNLHHTGVELDIHDMKKETGSRKSYHQLLGLLKINWLNTIRSPLKIFFMIIVPPILLVVGLVIMGNTSTSSKFELARVQIAPDLYLSSASSASYATPLLYQNSTGMSTEDVLKFLKDYKVNVEQVKSINDYMDIEHKEKPYRGLGLQIKTFPHENNITAKTNLLSSFLLRYNDTMVHSIPVGVNLITSLFNMYVLQAQNRTMQPIKTFFQPFPTLKPKWQYDTSGFVSTLLIGLAFVVFPGSFGILVIAQRQMGAYHLLRVSGVPTVIYWSYLFISDALLFVIPAVLMLIMIKAIGIVSLASSGAMGCLVLSVVLFIPSCTLFSYCISFFFDKWETAQNVLGTVFTYLGLLPFIAVSLVDMISSPDTAMILHYIFVVISPPYTIIGALYYINRIHMFASVMAQSNDITVPASDYFTWSKHNGIPVTFIVMALHSIIFCMLLYYLDTRKAGGRSNTFPCQTKSIPTRATSPYSGSFRAAESGDDDVQAEKDKLVSKDLDDPSNEGYAIAVKNLWKRFGKGKKQKVVVRDLYFGVQRGEVFGLLGPNGAGKTTTLNMITGNIPPSRGQVNVCGLDLTTNSYEVFQRIGYCPQTDALWPDITVEEHLICYCRVRGIPEADIKRTVDYFMSAMKVTEHASKKSKELSGGTKRKLSFQMAMLGGPELLLLDEPSTGLDPSARRFLWNTISANVRGDRGAILTTHSMEEADALSSRVGIVVRGELKCIGSTQHLKSKYGSGYSLEIKIKQGEGHEQSKVDDFVKDLFPGATLNEAFSSKSTYKVPKENVALLSSIFAKLEAGKQTIGIEEYSFSQSTLEQIFLDFARDQDDDRAGDKDNDEEIPQENGPQMA